MQNVVAMFPTITDLISQRPDKVNAKPTYLAFKDVRGRVRVRQRQDIKRSASVGNVNHEGVAFMIA